MEWPAGGQVCLISSERKKTAKRLQETRAAGGQGSRRMEHRAVRPGKPRLGGSNAVECKVAKKVEGCVCEIGE